MKKLLLVIPLALSLGACASLKTTWSVLTGASASPTQIIVAANAYDAGVISATEYRNYCIQYPKVSYCAMQIQQAVKKYVRAGRGPRDQLEPYIVSGSAGPGALYNALVTAVSSLQAQIPVHP